MVSESSQVAPRERFTRASPIGLWVVAAAHALQGPQIRNARALAHIRCLAAPDTRRASQPGRTHARSAAALGTAHALCAEPSRAFIVNRCRRYLSACGWGRPLPGRGQGRSQRRDSIEGNRRPQRRGRSRSRIHPLTRPKPYQSRPLASHRIYRPLPKSGVRLTLCLPPWPCPASAPSLPGVIADVSASARVTSGAGSAQSTASPPPAPSHLAWQPHSCRAAAMATPWASSSIERSKPCPTCPAGKIRVSPLRASRCPTPDSFAYAPSLLSTRRLSTEAKAASSMAGEISNATSIAGVLRGAAQQAGKRDSPSFPRGHEPDLGCCSP